MTDDIEERFRQACSAYLLMAEQYDRAHGDAEAAQLVLQRAQLDADRARDQLLQVVRERDAARQLGEYGPAGGPVGDGWDDERRAHYGGAQAPAGVTAVLGPDGRDTGATIIGNRIIPSARAMAARAAFFARHGITITREE